MSDLERVEKSTNNNPESNGKLANEVYEKQERQPVDAKPGGESGGESSKSSDEKKTKPEETEQPPKQQDPTKLPDVESIF
ncbi:MAG: hypothetical protein IPG59_03175 [Candidatus Melainabacteria bacterium]|nr:MAG: hypothetical protein IPG59_03175 [Candidatus Melainabacteria bacterium]